MKYIRMLVYLMVFGVVIGCDAQFEEINQRIDGIEDRIEYLEELCSQINTNIVSLQTLVNAVQENDCITSIVPIVAGEDTIGYIITFIKSGPVTIYNGKDGKDGNDGADGLPGKDGKDGYTPQIGVKLDEDGIYYWTLDGDWLLDDAGNKIPAQGADGTDGKDGVDGDDGTDGEDGKDGEDGQPGADGQDGVTPQLKIEEGYWYISYDNGLTWTQLGKATGEDGKDGVDGQDGQDGQDGKPGQDGDSMFESVTQDDQYVYFTLAGGDVLTVRKACELELQFEESNGIGCMGGETLRLAFTLTGADEGTVVECIGKGDWEAEVEMTDQSSGYVVVTAPEPMTDGKVVVLANNGAGYSDMKVLTFEQGVVLISDEIFELSGEASVVELTVATNLDYEVYIPDEAKSWISLAQNTKAVMHEETLCLSIEQYAVSQPDRTAKVELKYGGQTLQSVTIIQHSLGEAIYFEDPLVKQILVESTDPQIDLNGDGEITYEEAAQAVSLPDFGGAEVTTFKEYRYFESVTETGSFYHCELLTDIILPKSIITIRQNAFDGCFALQEIILPMGVEKIEWYTFNVCSSLESVYIPESVGEIQEGAFQMCSALKEVIIPASVYKLEKWTFNGCTSLARVEFAGAEPPAEFGEEVFSNCNNLTEIVVPAGSLETYRAVPALAPYVDLIVEE